MDFQKSAKIRDHINNFTFDQCGGVFIVNFKHIYYLFLAFLLLTWDN